MTPEIGEGLANGQITYVVSQGEDLWGKRIVEMLLKLRSGETVPEYLDTGTVMYDRTAVPERLAPDRSEPVPSV